MDLNKAQLLLDKINRLYKSMSLDPESVASIEKDLMKDYIKLLYGTFLEDGLAPKNGTSPQVLEKTRKPIVETARVVTPRATSYQPRVSSSPPANQVPIIEPPVEESLPPRAVPPRESRIVDTPNIRRTVPTSQPRPAASPPPKPAVFNEEEEHLFTLESETELSHKLGSLPVSDLNKAMGINERIFTINELFRGDSRAFKHTMSELNQLATFTDAKAYLAKHIVNQFDWTNKQRKNKAKNFIKLIRRRYL